MSIKVENISFHVRTDPYNFIVTMLTPHSTIYLYYVNKQTIKDKYNIDLDSLEQEYHKDKKSYLYRNPIELLNSLDYYKIPRR